MNAIPMTNEQRKHAGRKHLRYRCNRRLCVRYRANGQQFIAYGRCTIVGRGGIGAMMPAVELEIGQIVSLEISLATPAAPGVLKAQVKSHQGSTYGFQFLAADSRATAALHDLFRPEDLAAFIATPDSAPSTKAG
ncbi:MAG TPA: PilZ domain-containing protein [Terriglobia bacterium]|nr:PilZ domain-containing protein [Terriglobia bacterium]